MTTKELQIQSFLEEPIKPGDLIHIKGYGSQNKEFWGATVVKYVDDTYVYVGNSHGTRKIKDKSECEKYLISEIKRDTSHIGVNPFTPELRIQTYQIDIDQIIYRMGFDRGEKGNIIISERTEKYLEGKVKEVSFNPFVLSKTGERVFYQRGLVWSLKQKQLLIDSIYNNIEIGKFIVRKRSFSWLEKEIAKGRDEDLGFADVVDGKQRFHAILEFIDNKYTDSMGNYFSDLSGKAQYKFLSYRNLSWGEMDENATDEDVLNTFLAINHAGEPMSIEHIEYVKSLRNQL